MNNNNWKTRKFSGKSMNINWNRRSSKKLFQVVQVEPFRVQSRSWLNHLGVHVFQTLSPPAPHSTNIYPKGSQNASSPTNCTFQLPRPNNSTLQLPPGRPHAPKPAPKCTKNTPTLSSLRRQNGPKTIPKWTHSQISTSSPPCKMSPKCAYAQKLNPPGPRPLQFQKMMQNCTPMTDPV